MRGLQLGAACGARVTSAPTDADWRWADRVVLVKLAGLTWAATAHRFGLPIVWDALDCWRQPAENTRVESSARAMLRTQIAAIRPVLTIGATQAMARDVDGLCVPHHSWIGLVPTPARDDMRVVGYDGNPVYLDAWRPALESLCRDRGWAFVVNPPDLSAVDLLVALRGGPWDGWMCREWKSGVKLVNAICAGRPVITQPSAAWRELKPAGAAVETVSELMLALDAWARRERRQIAVEQSRARSEAFSVEAIGARYLEMLAGIGVAA